MADEEIRAGRIVRIVHVRFADTAGGDDANLVSCDGYAILQGLDGQDVFFVDSALQDAPFTDLAAGQDALYTIEPGPLGRAAKVWIATPRSRLQAEDNSRHQEAVDGEDERS